MDIVDPAIITVLIDSGLKHNYYIVTMVQLRRDLLSIIHKLFQGISMNKFTAANYEWTLPTTTVVYNFNRIGLHNHVECTCNWRQLGLNLHTSRTIAGALVTTTNMNILVDLVLQCTTCQSQNPKLSKNL